MPHTPGPWGAVHAGVESERGAIANCAFEGYEGCWRELDEMYANAHLIAAAPDLLLACEEVARILRERGMGGWETRLLGIADAAIAKAKGA